MAARWHTLWQGKDIVVFRNDVETDRFAADRIERVVFVHRDRGELPTDLVYAVVELAEDALLFPVDTGFAGRVNFERQAYWAERACVYWVPHARARLPANLRRGHWWPWSRGWVPSAGVVHLPKAELNAALTRWPLSGPQTWDQRKWQRIERSQPFSSFDAV